MFKKSINNYKSGHKVTILQVCDEASDAAAAQAATAAAAQAAEAVKLQAQIDAAVAEATKGLKAKNEELLGSLKTVKEKAKAFEGVDLAQLQALKAHLDNDEDSKLLAEGKKQVVIEKYTERMRLSHAAELKAKDDLIKAEAARADAYKGSVLDNQIRAVTSELHKGAVEDALLVARQIFTLDAKGNAVKLDSDGRPELGKDGLTPFSPAEWIEHQKSLKPHWFPALTSGSGVGNVRDASGTGKSVKRADFDRMSAADQAKTAREGIKITD